MTDYTVTLATNPVEVQVSGASGPSAYDLWIMTGHSGTLQDFFDAQTASAVAMANALAHFRPTLAQGVSDYAVGEAFSSNETGSFKAYQRISTAPYYTELFTVVTPADVYRGGGLDLFVNLGTYTIPATVNQLMTTGFSVLGRGAARYVRTSTPTTNEQTAGLNRWLVRTNSNTVWWRLAEAVVTDMMFGVVGDATISYASNTTTVSGTDDTAALQAAVHYVVEWNLAKRLILPQFALRKITDTIHVGYSSNYRSWIIEGDSRGAGNYTSVTGLGGIFFTANDRMLFNTQGARNGCFRSMSLFGINHFWLYNNYNSITDTSNKSNWRGPQMRSTSIDTSKSPHTAIAIDGYSGTAPANPYPTVTYPSWSGVSGQYNKSYSSRVAFEDLEISGFEVGIAVQPNAMPSASNGDFMTWFMCNLSFNEVGWVLSHADARVPSFRNCMAHFCHTMLDSVTYGGGTGNIAAQFDDCSFDNCYRVFYVNLGTTVQNFSQALVLTNCYCEATYSLGVVRTATTGRPGWVLIRGGEYNFYHGATRFAVLYTPKWYLDGLGEVRLEVVGVTITGTFGPFPVNCDVARFEASFPTLAYGAVSQSTTGGFRAIGALCHLWAPKCDSAAVRYHQFFGYQGDNITGVINRSDGWDPTMDGKAVSGSGGGRGCPIPWWVNSIAYKGFRRNIGRPPKFVLNRATYNITVSSQTDRTTVLAFSMDSLGAGGYDNPNYHFGVGDLVQDDQDGRLGYINAVSFSGTGTGQTATITIKWATGIHTTDGVNFTSNVSLSTNTGTLSFYALRRSVMGLTSPLLMNTTSGSGAVTIVRPGTETLPTYEMGASFIWPINVNDYLIGGLDAVDTDSSVFTSYTKFSAISSSGGIPSGSCTLNTNARRTDIWNAPLVMRV